MPRASNASHVRSSFSVVQRTVPKALISSATRCASPAPDACETITSPCPAARILATVSPRPREPPSTSERVCSNSPARTCAAASGIDAWACGGGRKKARISPRMQPSKLMMNKRKRASYFFTRNVSSAPASAGSPSLKRTDENTECRPGQTMPTHCDSVAMAATRCAPSAAAACGKRRASCAASLPFSTKLRPACVAGGSSRGASSGPSRSATAT